MEGVRDVMIGPDRHDVAGVEKEVGVSMERWTGEWSRVL